MTYSIIATTVVLLGFSLLVSGPKGSSVFSVFSRQLTKNQVTAFNGRTIFRKWENGSVISAENAGYVNDYRPSTTYANGSGDPENNGALVSSVTYADKKKAKKVKTKKGAVADSKSTASSRNNQLSANKDNANSGITGGGGGGSAGPSKAMQKAKEEEENLNTMEYWAEPIFTNEDPEAVTKLISSYQIQKVSSNVFYEVVSEMTHDERPLLREFAVTSLRATPSAKSFSQLAWIKLNDTDSDIRISAEQEVAYYSDVSRLGYVISSLKGGSSDSQKVSLEAMKVLVTASNNYGEIRAQNTGTPAITQQGAGMQLKLTQAYNTLGTLALSNDSTLKSEAEKTMESISKAITI